MFIQNELGQLYGHIINAIEDIEKARAGTYPALKEQLIGLYNDDDSTMWRTRKVRQHLRRAKSVLGRGFSTDELENWLNSGSANGAIVSYTLSPLPLHPFYYRLSLIYLL